jgi:hypothetical protein
MSPDSTPSAPVALLEPPAAAPSPAGGVSPAPAPLGRRLFRAAASLQLAIALLSLFTLCLALATFVESAYGGRVARELVYRTWWFTLLLALLAANVLCAALKKYPWKRHQTGFLITHAGLIVLVLGGLLSALGGTEGQMILIDSDDPEIQQSFRIANRADTLQLTDLHRLEVFRVPAGATPDDPVFRAMARVIDGGVEPAGELGRALSGHFWSLDLAPGSLAWYDDEHHTADLPAALRFLQVLADPYPAFTRDLDGTTSVTVNNFYPHAEQWPFARAKAGEPSFAALRVRLVTPMTRPTERWVSSVPAFERDPLPLALEVMTLPEPALLPEFMEPPAPSELGKLGRLVLLVGREKVRCVVDLDTLTPGKSVELPGTGARLTLLKTGSLMDLLPHEGDSKAPPGAPAYPAVQFELSSGGRKWTGVACSRLPNLPVFQDGAGGFPVAAWYHHPDFRSGDASRMGVVQFLQTPDERVYYRVYGKDGLRQTGREADVADNSAPVSLPWQAMSMQFQVTTYLPRAVMRPTVVPRRLRPGTENAEGMQPALRCTLNAGGESKEFWVRLSRQAERVEVGKSLYLVRYRNATQEADFALTLKRSYQTTDPGTSRPASFQSDVLVADRKGGTPSEFSIYMNHPLSHGPYKVYQSNYQPLTDPETMDLLVDTDGRPVSMSGLTVAHDPGLWCKYAGSALLVLGIATMFYMRAYFFKPRGGAATPRAQALLGRAGREAPLPV